MKTDDIDRIFIGKLRTNTKPIEFALGGDDDAYIIPNPDRQLMFELSLAIRSYQFRKNKQLKLKYDTRRSNRKN